MANISTLEQLVRPYVLDCPKFVVNSHLNRAVRTFCKDTHVWRASYPVTVVADQAEGVIPLAANVSAINVVSVKLLTVYLKKALNKSWLRTRSGEPTDYAVTALNGIAVGPIPEADAVFDVEVTLQPALSADEVDDFILEAWGEGIADGAVGTLLMMRDTPWYEPGQANYHKNMFEQAKTDAKNRLSVGFQFGNAIASGGKFI